MMQQANQRKLLLAAALNHPGKCMSGSLPEQASVAALLFLLPEESLMAVERATLLLFVAQIPRGSVLCSRPR